MRSQKRNRKENTPLDAKHKALDEKRAELSQRMAKLQCFIQEAPLLAEEEEKRRREESRARAAHGARQRASPASLADKRHTDALPRPGKGKKLRFETAELRRRFLLLGFVFLIVLGLIYMKFM